MAGRYEAVLTAAEKLHVRLLRLLTGALTCTLWTMPVLGSLGIWDLMTHGPGLSGIFLILGFLAAYVCFLGILCWMCLVCRRLRIARRLLVWMLLWIPFLNYGLALYVLGLAKQETDHILYRISLDDVRAEKNVCSTKYPLLLVHGVGFRDFHYFNYWGRIPRALKKNGARVFYGHQEAWGTVEENAGILREKIFEILRENGEEKVNIIAHSKGGLDCRCAMQEYGFSDHHLYAPPRLHAGGSFNEAAGFSVPGDLRPYRPVFWNAGRPGAQRLCCQPPVILCLDTGIQPEISGFIQRVLPELCQHDEMRGKLLASQYPLLDPEAPGRRERRACDGGVCTVDQFQGHS